jgi:hypothetical protein
MSSGSSSRIIGKRDLFFKLLRRKRFDEYAPLESVFKCI